MGRLNALGSEKIELRDGCAWVAGGSVTCSR
jgi:hypothetical protein